MTTFEDRISEYVCVTIQLSKLLSGLTSVLSLSNSDLIKTTLLKESINSGQFKKEVNEFVESIHLFNEGLTELQDLINKHRYVTNNLYRSLLFNESIERN